MSAPRIPVVSNVDAQPHQQPDEIRELLVKQVCAPVLWEDSMRWMIGEGMSEYYEVGPGRVLRGLMKRMGRDVRKMPGHGVMPQFEGDGLQWWTAGWPQ